MNRKIEERPLPQCPFWRKTEKPNVRLGCEGLTDHSRIILVFETGQEKRQHEDVFCCEHYDYCEIFHAIMEAKYAGEDA